ncbi:MAG: hypothetical protein HOW73_10170 [Polyangiaceae bacterium]|nr:hypothetical protein [Polyangiaceae bacterium]
MKAWLLLGVCAAPFFAGCGGDASGAPSASAVTDAATPSSAEPGEQAAASPLTVALEAKDKLVLSSVGGGIVVLDESGKHIAHAKDGADLEARAMPTGLPKDLSRIQYVGGRLPESLWLSVALEPEAKKKTGKTPFYRATSKLKEISEDWQPLVVPWSKKRTLAISTSSGRLKIKQIEPFTKTSPEDQPARYVPDVECGKSLKLAEATSLPSGEVVSVGRCSMGSDKKASYVLVRWPVAATPAAAPADTAAAAPKATPTASAEVVEATAPAAGEPADAKEEDEKKGAPMTLLTLGTDKLRHRALAVRSENEIYAAVGADAAGATNVVVVEKDKVSPVTLPTLDSPILDMAVTASGELWLVTANKAYRRPAQGTWAEVAPPAKTQLERVEAAGDTIWIAGQKGSGNAAKGVLLKLGAAKPIEWK